MTVAAYNINRHDLSSHGRPIAPPGSMDACAVNEDDRADAMVRILRETLAEEGFSESTCAKEEGFYFIVESAGEISIQYNAAEQEVASTHVLSLNRIEAGVLKCCSDFVKRGFTLTLFMSPRTMALHVRYEC